ncbi:uncharacterized protein RSE6_12817 [Rhynchosporium secalis]|uniref:Uncharacterized protein n=1 Tax=Rhynchosporium secalis TaxID=38038 RepID=A0A1E1MS70_RHYSE|nr:uncharacterized protein RSE6_12817 [Rhynchosporium secalis]
MFLQPRIHGLLIFILSTLVRTYDVSTELEPKGPLGIRLDYNVAMQAGTAERNDVIRTVVFTSHLKFEHDVNAFSDGQLVQMAFDAYNEMLVEAARYDFHKTRATPSVMTVLAIEKEIFMASSQKGQGSFIHNFPHSPVSKSLAVCQAIFSDRTSMNRYHENQAKCGEIMAAHSFFRANPSFADLKGLGGRTISVDRLKGTEPLAIKEPCGTGIANVWGCDLFVENQGLAEVP